MHSSVINPAGQLSTGVKMFAYLRRLLEPPRWKDVAEYGALVLMSWVVMAVSIDVAWRLRIGPWGAILAIIGTVGVATDMLHRFCRIGLISSFAIAVGAATVIISLALSASGKGDAWSLVGALAAVISLAIFSERRKKSGKEADQ
jgi:hypothetical protein